MPVNKVKIGLFMGVGFLAWFYGMHQLFAFNTIQAGGGVGQEFLFIIAAVVGGTLLTGGYGSAVGYRAGCVHLRDDPAGHCVCGLGPELVQGIPGRDVVARRRGEPVGQEVRHHHGRHEQMTDTLSDHADPTLHKGEPLIEMNDVGQGVRGDPGVVRDQPVRVGAGEVTCVLGDNGAGKSTLIKIMSGLHGHTEGSLKVDGEEVNFGSPRESLDHGIATVYQDLAVVGLMEVWRNFFLGSELTAGKYPLAPLKIKEMREIADSELKKMGITVKDINQPIGTLSGGQRQCVAIARAVYFGARVLILDEPTAALGVKQSGVVLKYTAAARDAGSGRRLHHPQPAPRVPGREPLHHPQTR